MNTPWEVPYVRKEAISLVAIGDPLETMALRGVLERFNYRVEVHWVGSRKEVLEILRGKIEIFPYVILSCHGDNLGGILVPNEPAITVNDLAVSLPERVILNLGCGAGKADAAARFLQGGCRAYIAPRDEVESSSALMFAIHLYYFLKQQHALSDAVRFSRQHDAECELFELWERKA